MYIYVTMTSQLLAKLINPLNFFQQLFGCPKPNFESVTRSPHSHNINHYATTICSEGHLEPRKEIGSQSPAECISGFQTGSLPILRVTPYSTGQLTPTFSNTLCCPDLVRQAFLDLEIFMF